MIPKIIHFTWFGPKEPPLHLMQTWIDKNPDYEVKLWTEKNIGELINQKQFEAINEYCGKSDIARYEILYKYGGFYFDIDSKCLESLGDDLINYHGLCFWENEIKRPGLIANGYLGFEAGNKIMGDMIDLIGNIPLKEINKDRAWRISGPLPFSQVVKNNLDKISILPSYYFMPRHITGETYHGNGKIYGEQYWATGLEIRNKL